MAEENVQTTESAPEEEPTVKPKRTIKGVSEKDIVKAYAGGAYSPQQIADEFNIELEDAVRIIHDNFGLDE